MPWPHSWPPHKSAASSPPPLHPVLHPRLLSLLGFPSPANTLKTLPWSGLGSAPPSPSSRGSFRAHALSLICMRPKEPIHHPMERLDSAWHVVRTRFLLWSCNLSLAQATPSLPALSGWTPTPWPPTSFTRGTDLQSPINVHVSHIRISDQLKIFMSWVYLSPEWKHLWVKGFLSHLFRSPQHLALCPMHSKYLFSTVIYFIKHFPCAPHWGLLPFGFIFVTNQWVYPLVPSYGGGKWGSEDVNLLAIVASEWQSRDLNPGQSTQELELELLWARSYSSHGDRDCDFP